MDLMYQCIRLLFINRITGRCNRIPIYPQLPRQYFALLSKAALRNNIPGGDVKIQIRGITSLNGSDPLVIIDGVQGDINQVNVNDVESVEILKDAASAAIFGVSGDNGVILITTKKEKIRKQ